MPEDSPAVLATERALSLIERLRRDNGPIMFHQSGGCCDGSSPMCYKEGDFIVGGADYCLGAVGGCDFYMSRDQYELWKHTRLTLDVVEGRGSSFSLEIPLGLRFVILSEVIHSEKGDTND